MKKKVTRKDFYMEIRRSPGRFLSILFIVALGVAFFSGIRAAEPSMRITGDAYFDGDSLMDIKALSTYGVTEDDVKAIEEVEGVADAEGAYSADFLYNVEDEQTVLHVMSLQEQMNEVTVSEGRLPEKVGECLADDESNFQIGDVITLESGTDDPVSDTLKTEKLEVVGRGNSPCYISYGRGSTTIGTGNIDAFLIVPESTFDLDVYTEVYVRVEGAEKLLAFSDEYEDCVEEVMDHIEAITDERASVRRQEIVDEANEKLADARKELEDGKQEAEKELNDAAQELADAKKQLDDAKQKISDGRQQIADAKSTLAEKQQELDAAKAQYQSGVQQLAEGRMAYESGLAQFEAGKAQAEAQIKEGEVGLELMRQSLDASWIEYEQLLAMIPESPQEGTPEYEKWKEDNQELLMQAEQMKAALDAQEQIYQEQTANLEAAKQQLLETQKMLDSTKAQLDASEAELMQADQKLQDGQAQIQSGWKEIQDSEKELADGEAEIAENEAKLADARTEYEEGKAEAEAEIADGEAEIADAEEEIAKIESPKWYVYDRSTLTEYNGLGENAERIGAIGRVFPVIFFLVAALISLTSMTRMVEEQRISIGTMKALGYGKFTIAAKYLGYALLATAGGSIFGVLVGEKILPYIIIYAYGILYRHIPKILVAVICIAILCVTVISFRFTNVKGENASSGGNYDLKENVNTSADDEFTGGKEYKYSDEDLNVTVTLPKETAVPSDAVLSVKRITNDNNGEQYSELEKSAKEAVSGTLESAAYYDISFYTSDGSYIDVSDKAKVSFDYNDKVPINVTPDNTSSRVGVLHFTNGTSDAVDVKNLVTDNDKVNNNNNNKT